jgi:hypothetical protein
MRKIIGAIAVATLVGAGAVAMTTGAAAADRTRTVEFTGTSVFDGPTECGTFRQVFDGTVATARGDTLHIDGCVELVGFPYPYTGTFVIDSPGRRDLTGTVTGVIGTEPSATCSGDYVPMGFEFVLTPTAERGRPAPPLQADGTWCSSSALGVPGPISGTLTGPLPHGHG